MTPKRQRMWMVIIGAAVLCGGVSLVLSNFSQHIIYFYTPTQLKSAHVMPDQIIRLGGMVEMESIQRKGGQKIRFTVTDLSHSTQVRYEGLLPSLFKEGQGVVAQGSLDADGTLHATQILAKHDENYMPREVMEELKKSGRWQHYSDENKKAYQP